MGSLAGAMGIATGAALAQQEALQITADNVANVNTAGYTQKVPELETEAGYFNGHYEVGDGVTLRGSESLRDRVLELRIADQEQTQGALDSYVTAMTPVQEVFSGTSDVGTSIDNFFSSLQQLSADPTNTALRETALSDASSVAESFQSTAQTLAQTQSSLNNDVTQLTEQVNSLTQQIAALNPEVTQLEKVGADTGTYEDQRTELVQQLSEVANVQITNGDDGITITTASGTPLVVGNQAYALTTATNTTTGMEDVYNGAKDVTADFTGGNLGGTLQARDQDLPALMTSLDTLAYNFANAVNTANAKGYDLNGKAGGDIFTAPTAVTGAALNLTVAMTDGAGIAASADTSTGGNGNMTNLLAVQTSSVVNGETPSDAYSNLVYQVGSMVSNATSEQTASQAMLTQLQNQRNALSGVSLDEQATNLIQYQRAFEAAARVINAVDECTQTALGIGINES
jgi:flagellar hook-associated protein 1 FlgK